MSSYINQLTDKDSFFGEIYAKYWDKILHKVCMKYTKDRNKAEDYCQNGFLKVYNNLHKYSAQGSIEGWIARIVRNNIIDEIRRERELTCLSGYEDVIVAEEEYQEPEYNVEMVYNVLDKLPHYAKQAFDMYYIEGLKHDEIAEKLNITASTSKTNLMKAKIKIRTLLNV